MELKNLWKPTVVLLVVGVIATDGFFDQRQNSQIEAAGRVSSALNLPTGTQVGELVPDFAADTLDDNTIHLSDYRGKTILVNLFASWCGPCRLEMPHLVDVYNQIDAQKVVF